MKNVMCVILMFSIGLVPYFVSAKHNFRTSSQGPSLEEIELQSSELEYVSEALDQAECHNGQCHIRLAGSLGMVLLNLWRIMNKKDAYKNTSRAIDNAVDYLKLQEALLTDVDSLIVYDVDRRWNYDPKTRSFFPSVDLTINQTDETKSIKQLLDEAEIKSIDIITKEKPVPPLLNLTQDFPNEYNPTFITKRITITTPSNAYGVNVQIEERIYNPSQDRIGRYVYQSTGYSLARVFINPYRTSSLRT